MADLIRERHGRARRRAGLAEELAARKSSLIGDYGRGIATAAGLAGALDELALYGIDLGEIKSYTDKVEAVTPGQVQAFAQDVLNPTAPA